MGWKTNTSVFIDKKCALHYHGQCGTGMGTELITVHMNEPTRFLRLIRDFEKAQYRFQIYSKLTSLHLLSTTNTVPPTT